MKARQLRLGMRVRFVPGGWLERSTAEQTKAFGVVPVEVVGRIVYINRPHRWFRVAYKCGNTTLHEGFKF